MPNLIFETVGALVFASLLTGTENDVTMISGAPVSFAGSGLTADVFGLIALFVFGAGFGVVFATGLAGVRVVLEALVLAAEVFAFFDVFVGAGLMFLAAVFEFLFLSGVFEVVDFLFAAVVLAAVLAAVLAGVFLGVADVFACVLFGFGVVFFFGVGVAFLFVLVCALSTVEVMKAGRISIERAIIKLILRARFSLNNPFIPNISFSKSKN